MEKYASEWFSIFFYHEECFSYGNFRVILEGKKVSLMENMFFSLGRIENFICANNIYQGLFLLAHGLVLGKMGGRKWVKTDLVKSAGACTCAGALAGAGVWVQQ